MQPEAAENRAAGEPFAYFFPPIHPEQLSRAPPEYI